MHGYSHDPYGGYVEHVTFPHESSLLTTIVVTAGRAEIQVITNIDGERHDADQVTAAMETMLDQCGAVFEGYTG